jgi:hypothetical protein
MDEYESLNHTKWECNVALQYQLAVLRLSETRQDEQCGD